jgi:hypothetical protein
MIPMAFLKAPPGRSPGGRSATALSTYPVGQRTVQLFQLADGHVQWVCNCEDYAASAGSAQGAWCKHVAKASAIRSIERLTGARVVARSRAASPAAVAQSAETSVPEVVSPAQTVSQSH